MGAAGFLIASVAGQLSGAWVYWRVRGATETRPSTELRAATASGFVTALIASAAYIPLGIHTWAGGTGTHWGLSVFLGICLGICQAVLFRGSPLAPPLRAGAPSEKD